MVPRGMGNVLDHDKQHQVLGLGRLGWSLRRIEEATGVRRETASGYLRAAGMPVRGPRAARRRAGKTGHYRGGVHRLLPSKPAIAGRCPPTRRARRRRARRVRARASRTAS